LRRISISAAQTSAGPASRSDEARPSAPIRYQPSSPVATESEPKATDRKLFKGNLVASRRAESLGRSGVGPNLKCERVACGIGSAPKARWNMSDAKEEKGGHLHIANALFCALDIQPFSLFPRGCEHMLDRRSRRESAAPSRPSPYNSIFLIDKIILLWTPPTAHRS